MDCDVAIASNRVLRVQSCGQTCQVLARVLLGQESRNRFLICPGGTPSWGNAFFRLVRNSRLVQGHINRSTLMELTFVLIWDYYGVAV